MEIIFKLIVSAILAFYVFKAFFVDLFIIFYKPARDVAVKSIQDQGLDKYVRDKFAEDFFRHLFIILIVGKIFFAVFSYTETTDDSGKSKYNIEVKSK